MNFPSLLLLSFQQNKYSADKTRQHSKINGVKFMETNGIGYSKLLLLIINSIVYRHHLLRKQVCISYNIFSRLLIGEFHPLGGKRCASQQSINNFCFFNTCQPFTPFLKFLRCLSRPIRYFSNNFQWFLAAI